MKTLLATLTLLSLGFAALAFVPSAAAVCAAGNCVETGGPFCVARYYTVGGDYLYVGCNYFSKTVCAAAIYDASNNNHGIGCVATDNGGCIQVAVLTNDNEGSGWTTVFC